MRANSSSAPHPHLLTAAALRRCARQVAQGAAEARTRDPARSNADLYFWRTRVPSERPRATEELCVHEGTGAVVRVVHESAVRDRDQAELRELLHGE